VVAKFLASIVMWPILAIKLFSSLLGQLGDFSWTILDAPPHSMRRFFLHFDVIESSTPCLL